MLQQPAVSAWPQAIRHQLVELPVPSSLLNTTCSSCIMFHSTEFVCPTVDCKCKSENRMAGTRNSALERKAKPKRGFRT